MECQLKMPKVQPMEPPQDCKYPWMSTAEHALMAPLPVLGQPHNKADTPTLLLSPPSRGSLSSKMCISCWPYCLAEQGKGPALWLVTQACPALCDPMNCSSPGSSVHGIFQAWILEWVAIPFSRGSSRPRHWTWVACIAGRSFTGWATREAS